MANLNISVDAPSATIGTLNDKVKFTGNSRTDLQGAIAFLEAIISGNFSASVQITTSSSATTITPTGTGSMQVTHNKK